MSLKRVLEKLESLGLSHTDSVLYIYLAKNGPKKGRDLRNILKMSKQNLYLSLKNLRNKQIVIANNESPSEYCAVSFEKVLDLLIEIKIKQSEVILETKKGLLSNWRSIDWKNNS